MLQPLNYTPLLIYSLGGKKIGALEKTQVKDYKKRDPARMLPGEQEALSQVPLNLEVRHLLELLEAGHHSDKTN